MKLFKNLLKVFAVTVVVATTYLVYFYFIGVPRTQARYYYNQGLIALENHDKTTAKADFEKGLTYWSETYILEDLKKLN